MSNLFYRKCGVFQFLYKIGKISVGISDFLLCTVKLHIIFYVLTRGFISAKQ